MALITVRSRLVRRAEGAGSLRPRTRLPVLASRAPVFFFVLGSFFAKLTTKPCLLRGFEYTDFFTFPPTYPCQPDFGRGLCRAIDITPYPVTELGPYSRLEGRCTSPPRRRVHRFPRSALSPSRFSRATPASFALGLERHVLGHPQTSSPNRSTGLVHRNPALGRPQSEE
jgi:hypothetical protein